MGTSDQPSLSQTYFANDQAKRPMRLFEVATSHLLFFTVANNPNLNAAYRPGAWVELGLARYLEHSMTGPAGRAELGTWTINKAEAGIVLKHAKRDLAHVSRYDTKKYYGQMSDDNLFEWPAAELAVAYFLEGGKASGMRDRFCGYVQEIQRVVRGTSSSVLDRHMGQPIEKLDQPWREWIRTQLPPPKPAPTSKQPVK